MKKFTIGCILAAAGCGAIFAGSDYISLYKDGYLNKIFKVDEISNISYTGKVDKGYTTMKVNFKDGGAEEFSIDAVDGLTYDKSRGDCTVSMTPIQHYESVQLDIRPQNENTYYRISGATQSQLTSAGIDRSLWGEVLMNTDIEYIYSVAESWGQPLSHFSPDDIFEHGTQVRDWFPSIPITPGTPLALCIYTCRLEGDEVVATCDPQVVLVNTKELQITDIDFTLTAELKSNRITVRAQAPAEHADHPFYVGLVTKYDVDTKGWDTVVGSLGAQLEQMVYSTTNPTTWDAVTFKGSGEDTFRNLAEGEQYYAVVFGCDYGIVDTTPKYELLTVPEADVTDPCTFEAVATQKSPSEFEVKITPSSSTTRYGAMLINKDDITASNTVSRIIGKQIQYYNKTNTMKWDTTDLLHTGEATVNTHDGVIGGAYLNGGEEYVLAIFGIDSETTRTTAIKEVNIVPQSQSTEATTFDVQFGEFKATSNWSHTLSFTVTPSDPNAKYVCEYLPVSNYAVDLSQTDEEFINNYVAVQGEYLVLRQGESSRTMSMSSKYSYDAGGYVFEDYILFIFGYDGEATTPLYMYRINSDTGETEMLRGPQTQPAMTFDLTPGEFNATSNWSHSLSFTVTPSDPEAKYVCEYLPSTNYVIDLSKTDEEFINDYVAVQGEYLVLRQGVHNRTMSMSSSYDYEAGGYVFGDYILFIFGYDGEATTPLYMYRVNAGTGEMTQLRGPGTPEE